jgi:hypothetical protein
MRAGPGFGEFVNDQETIFERIGRGQDPKTSAVVDHGTPGQWHGAKATTTVACKNDDEVRHQAGGTPSRAKPSIDSFLGENRFYKGSSTLSNRTTSQSGASWNCRTLSHVGRSRFPHEPCERYGAEFSFSLAQGHNPRLARQNRLRPRMLTATLRRPLRPKTTWPPTSPPCRPLMPLSPPSTTASNAYTRPCRL